MVQALLNFGSPRTAPMKKNRVKKHFLTDYLLTILTRLWRGGCLRILLTEPAGITVGQSAEFFNFRRHWPFCDPRRDKPPNSCKPLSSFKVSVV